MNDKEQAFINGKFAYLLDNPTNPYHEPELKEAWNKGWQDSAKVDREFSEKIKNLLSRIRVIRTQQDIDQLVSDISIKMDNRQN